VTTSCSAVARPLDRSALVWWGHNLDEVISPFVHQGIIRRQYAHREGSIYDGELYALAVVFSGRLILGQPWADSYPHRYEGDSETALTPIRAEMFKDGAASTVNLPGTAVLIEAPGHEEGELTLDPRDLLDLVWQSLPRLIELLRQARPNPGETADTFPWRELGLPVCPDLIPY
jgi:hypothetical protein